jgi:hypothetical protein
VLSRTWTIIEGEQVAPETARLFRLDGNVETRQDDADIARDLDASLRQWMGAVGMPPALG